jgi:hypothetical protein
LVSDIGVNKIFRITLSNKALTTLYSGPDQIKGLVYNPSGDLFANDLTLQAVLQLDPTSGDILNQTPGSSPLTTPDGLTFDVRTQKFFVTSSTAQVIYSISSDLTTVSSIGFSSVPVLEGITSNGAGILYLVGGNGTTNMLFKYDALTGTQTTLNTVPGLDGIALVPFGPCIKKRGTDAECEDPDDEMSVTVPASK